MIVPTALGGLPAASRAGTPTLLGRILGLLILLANSGCHDGIRSSREDLLDLSILQPALRLDLRYATANNFTGHILYPSPRAFLLAPTAHALLSVEEDLKRQGYGLLIYDAYRPQRITQALFDSATPQQRREGYVADPSKGSRHNRGCAVDLGLWDLQQQQVALMPTGFDEFSERAHSDASQGPTEALQNRERLRSAMAKEGFKELPNEWWHFDDRDCDSHPIRDWVWWDQTP